MEPQTNPIYKVLPGLPPYGGDVTNIGGQAFYSEGFVIQFFKGDGSSWIGNFCRGQSKLDVVYPATRNNLWIIAGGVVYLMSPEDPKPIETFGYGYVSVFESKNRQLAMYDLTEVAIIEPNGERWKTRISWDGFKDVTIKGNLLTGLSWDPMDKDQEWVPFSLNLDTREVKGGSHYKYKFTPTSNPNISTVERIMPWWRRFAFHVSRFIKSHVGKVSVLLFLILCAIPLLLGATFINNVTQAYFSLFYHTLPLLIVPYCFLLFPIKSKIWKTLVLVALPFFVLIYSFVFMFQVVDTISIIQRGEDSSFREIQRINVGAKDFVVYSTDCGATCDHGVVFRQERRFLPGMTFDHYVLGTYYHANEVYFRKTGTCSVVLDHISGYGEESSIPKNLGYRLCGGARTDMFNHFIGSNGDAPVNFQCENGDKFTASVKQRSGEPWVTVTRGNGEELYLNFERINPVQVFGNDTFALTFNDGQVIQTDRTGPYSTICHMDNATTSSEAVSAPSGSANDYMPQYKPGLQTFSHNMQIAKNLSDKELINQLHKDGETLLVEYSNDLALKFNAHESEAYFRKLVDAQIEDTHQKLLVKYGPCYGILMDQCRKYGD
jgi:hypothetical protein